MEFCIDIKYKSINIQYYIYVFIYTYCHLEMLYLNILNTTMGGSFIEQLSLF